MLNKKLLCKSILFGLVASFVSVENSYADISININGESYNGGVIILNKPSTKKENLDIKFTKNTSVGVDYQNSAKSLCWGGTLMNNNKQIKCHTDALYAIKIGLYNGKNVYSYIKTDNTINKTFDKWSKDYSLEEEWRHNYFLKGYKILFDLIYNGKKNIIINEVDIIFKKRSFEKSKFNLKVICLFLGQMLYTKFLVKK